MVIIAPGLFGWQEVNGKSDSKRLELVLKNLIDEELMRHLEGERDKGRDDYPIDCQKILWSELMKCEVRKVGSLGYMIKRILLYLSLVAGGVKTRFTNKPERRDGIITLV